MSASRNNTPRSQLYSTSDEATADDVATLMAKILQNMGQDIDSLTAQTKQLSCIKTATIETTRESEAIRSRLLEHSEAQEEDIRGLKAVVRNDVRSNVVRKMKAQIKQEVRKEIVRQAQVQADEQIKENIPTPLQIQLKENQRQKAAVDVSLYNSNSRIKNATLDASSQDEPIEPVLTESGERSKYFPATLRTLFSYNLETLKALLCEFELVIDEDSREVNFNRFLSHIGANSITLVVQAD